MGRVFYSFDEAATRLGKSKRTIHNYVKKGLLRRVVEDGDVVLHREEVDQLADELGTDAPAMNRKTFLELVGRIRRLEEQMSVFRKMYGIEDRPPLRPDVEEARRLHDNVVEALLKKTYLEPEIELWVSVFSRMDEVTFDLMMKAGLTTSFWIPFFRLCLAMMDFISDPSKSGSNPRWFKLHMELDECRKKLRATALMWVEMGRGTVPEGILKQLGTGKDDLMRRLRGHGKS